MGIIWLVVFFLNLLFASGIMVTYLARNHKNKSLDNDGPNYNLKRALVILPIRGVDYRLEENLESLKKQTWKNYDVIAVVDSEDDSSVPFLKNAGIRYIHSSEKCDNCSGKVRAILSALRKFPSYDFYVIADSDIRVKREWLSLLLAQLNNYDVGVSTSFPVFYPVGGFWSRVKMFWGAVGQSMMESDLTKFVWGGSMAFRRDFIDEDLIRELSNSISDDVAVLRIVKNKGLKISYVPDAAPDIYSNEDFTRFMEWSNRQTSFSMYSTKKVFIFGIIYYGITIYLVISSILFSVLVNTIFLLFIFPFIFNSINSQRKLPVKVWYFFAITFILPFIYAWNLIQGLWRNEVTWRGRVYNLSKNYQPKPESTRRY
ncbi:MAG: glycosyltransferase family 2 protein [Thermoplasmatales archaeon]